MYIVQCRDGGVREYVGVERGKKVPPKRRLFSVELFPFSWETSFRLRGGLLFFLLAFLLGGFGLGSGLHLLGGVAKLLESFQEEGGRGLVGIVLDGDGLIF